MAEAKRTLPDYRYCFTNFHSISMKLYHMLMHCIVSKPKLRNRPEWAGKQKDLGQNLFLLYLQELP